MDYGQLVAARESFNGTDEEFRAWANTEITVTTTKKPIDSWGGTLSDEDIAVANREVAKLRLLRELEAQAAAARQQITAAVEVPESVTVTVE